MYRYPFFFLLPLFVGTALWAGAQLSPAELVRRSSAIAMVSVQWSPETPKVTEVNIENWLKAPVDAVRTSIKKNPKQKQEWIGVCLPDAALLKHWLKTYPHFEKNNQSLWRKALRQTSYRSLVFFRSHPATGHFRPTCETETLQSLGWQTHENAKTYRAQIEAEILKANTLGNKPVGPTSSQLKAKKKPSKDSEAAHKGCRCQSSR